MSQLSKQALKVANNESFPNNNTNYITPAILREYNTDIIDSMVDEIPFGAYTQSVAVTIDNLNNYTASSAVSESLSLVTASVSGQTLTFTKGNNSTFDVTLPSGSGGTTDTGSLMLTGSVNQNVLTFTKGDGSTFDLTVAASGSAPAGTISGSAQITALGFVSSSVTGSSLITASFNNGTRNLTFTKGDATQFSVNIPDVSGSTGNFVTTSSFNAYTASTDSSISQLNASTASQQISINALNTNSASVNTSITNLNTTTASLNSSITQLNASSASQQISINALNTNSASVNTSITNLNSTTASLNTSVTNLNSATSSLFGSASLGLTTASFDNGTRNLTFTKGNNQTFSVNIPDVSGSAGNFVTTSSFNEYTASNDQKVNSLISATGSYATTGSNTFNGVQTIRAATGTPLIVDHNDSTPTQNTLIGIFKSGSAEWSIGNLGTDDSFVVYNPNTFQTPLSIRQDNGVTLYGTLTASLQEGYVWAGGTGNVSKLVATSSFGGGTIPNGTISSSAQITELGFVSSSVTASSLVTASINNSTNTITFTKGNGTTFDILVQTGSVSPINTGSFATTGSNSFTGTQTLGLGAIVPNGQDIAFEMLTGSIAMRNNVGLNRLLFLDPISNQKYLYIDKDTAEVHVSGAFSAQLANGYAWVGDSTGRSTQVATSSFAGTTINTGSFATTGSNVFVGNQTIYKPEGKLLFQSGSSNLAEVGMDAAGNLQFQVQSTQIGLLGQSSIALQKNTTINGNATINGTEVVNGDVWAVGGNRNFTSAANTAGSGSQYPGFTAVVSSAETPTDIFGGFSVNNSAASTITAHVVNSYTPQYSGVATPVILAAGNNPDGNDTAIGWPSNGQADHWKKSNFKYGIEVTGSTNIQSLTASLAEGYVWVGNSTGKTTTVATSSFAGGVPAGTATTGSNVFRGDQTISGSVYVSGSINLFSDGANGFAYSGKALFLTNSVQTGITVESPIHFYQVGKGDMYIQNNVAGVGSGSLNITAANGANLNISASKVLIDSDLYLDDNGGITRFALNNNIDSEFIGIKTDWNETGNTLNVYGAEETVELTYNGWGTGYDNGYIVNVGSTGTQFQDWNTSYTNQTWLKIPVNNDNNPKPIMTRGLEVTGSTEVGTFTASLANGYTYVGGANGRTTTVATSSFGTSINTGSFATTGSNQFIGNQTITGSLTTSGSTVTIMKNGGNGLEVYGSGIQSQGSIIGNNGLKLYGNNSGIEVAANAQLSGSAYSQWFIYVDNNTDPTNVFSSMNILDATTFKGLGLAWSSYSPYYSTSTPMIFANDNYNGSDTAIAFPTNIIEVWKPMYNKAPVAISGSFELTGSAHGNVVSASITSNTASIDFSKGNYFEVTSSVTPLHLNITNVTPGTTSTLIVSASASSSITFSPNVAQPSGNAYSGSAGSIDILSLVAFNASKVNVVSTKALV